MLTVEESHFMKTGTLRLVTDEAPTTAKLTVGNPGRKANVEYRGREYLTENEVDKVHPHMLPHARGHVLANRGVDTRSLQFCLGHRNIQHTVRYTELAPDRLKHIRG
jgi:integrase